MAKKAAKRVSRVRRRNAPAPDLTEHAELCARHSRPIAGRQLTAVPRLQVFRADQPSEPTPSVYEPMFCLVVQGKKRGFIRGEVAEYRAGDGLLVTVDLPIVGKVLEAKAGAPYLAMCVELHRPTLASVVLEAELGSLPQGASEPGLCVARAEPAVIDTALRLVRLLDSPADIPVLAPLVERELLYRLLTGPWGRTMLEISRADSRLSQVQRAVAWLRGNFAAAYDAEHVAHLAAMSVSSLNRHFRAVTGMSPLEYHKQIRLQEARRALLVGEDDVASVGHAVGYNSVSQFTREYRRVFGAPPGRDAERLRAGARSND